MRNQSTQGGANFTEARPYADSPTMHLASVSHSNMSHAIVAIAAADWLRDIQLVGCDYVGNNLVRLQFVLGGVRFSGTIEHVHGTGFKLTNLVPIS